jgi:hypothetical protein
MPSREGSLEILNPKNRCLQKIRTAQADDHFSSSLGHLSIAGNLSVILGPSCRLSETGNAVAVKARDISERAEVVFRNRLAIGSIIRYYRRCCQ